MNEIWKDIFFIREGKIWDYRGVYQVSNSGKIKIIKTNCIMKKHINNSGYEYVQLSNDKYKNKKRKYWVVHQLVAHMFCNGYKNGLEVDHLNTIRTDNRAENLSWKTIKENKNNELTKQHYAKSSSDRWKNKTEEEVNEWKKNLSESQKGERAHFYGKERPDHSEKMKGIGNSNIGEKVARIDKNTLKILEIKYRFEYIEDGYNGNNISACCIRGIPKSVGKGRGTKSFIFKKISDCTEEQLKEYFGGMENE